MTRRTHKIGDVTLNIVNTETEGLYATLTQGDDVIVLSVDQSREIAAIIDEV